VTSVTNMAWSAGHVTGRASAKAFFDVGSCDEDTGNGRIQSPPMSMRTMFSPTIHGNRTSASYYSRSSQNRGNAKQNKPRPAPQLPIYHESFITRDATVSRTVAMLQTQATAGGGAIAGGGGGRGK